MDVVRKVDEAKAAYIVLSGRHASNFPVNFRVRDFLRLKFSNVIQRTIKFFRNCYPKGRLII